MTSKEKVHYWLDIAAYDIETAEAMYQTGRWLYVAFMCPFPACLLRRHAVLLLTKQNNCRNG